MDIRTFIRSLTIERTSKWGLALVVIFGLGVSIYLGIVFWKPSQEIIQKLPAGMLRPFEMFKQTEKGPPIIPKKNIPAFPPPGEEAKYIEVAKKGEGITHLARRALKEYLSKNPQSFKLTPEHKVYIEDYIAKKKGGRWLRLGEKMEFSLGLLKEAIEKSKSLSPKDLENLTQYSQLVPSLNY